MSTDPAAAATQVTEMQNLLNTSLETALGRLSEVETPVPAFPAGDEAKPKKRKPAPPPPEAADSVPEEAAAPPPPPPKEEQPAPPQPPLWGPAQAKALQEVLSQNQRMEAELAALREEAGRYKGIVDQARGGDVAGFAEKANLTPQEMLEALQNGTKVPVTRPYVQKLESTVGALESKLSALEARLAERDAAEKQQHALSAITTELQAKPEYGILTKIPDAASRIQAMVAEREAEARSRGEVPSFTTAQAAQMLKASLLESLKSLVSDDAVRAELGLTGGDVTPPPPVKARSSKAITSTLTASGSMAQTKSYDPQAQLQLALRNWKV